MSALWHEADGLHAHQFETVLCDLKLATSSIIIGMNGGKLIMRQRGNKRDRQLLPGHGLVEPLHQVGHQSGHVLRFRGQVDDRPGAVVANDVLAIPVRCCTPTARHHQAVEGLDLCLGERVSLLGKSLHLRQGLVVAAHLLCVTHPARNLPALKHCLDLGQGEPIPSIWVE